MTHAHAGHFRVRARLPAPPKWPSATFLGISHDLGDFEVQSRWPPGMPLAAWDQNFKDFIVKWTTDLEFA